MSSIKQRTDFIDGVISLLPESILPHQRNHIRETFFNLFEVKNNEIVVNMDLNYSQTGEVLTRLVLYCGRCSFYKKKPIDLYQLTLLSNDGCSGDGKNTTCWAANGTRYYPMSNLAGALNDMAKWRTEWNAGQRFVSEHDITIDSLENE